MAHERSVLLVDDDAAMCRMLIDQLAELGVEAVAAESVDSALALLRGRAFSAILTDLNMPKKDGFELLRAIHGSASSPPVILMTSFGDESTARRATDAGAFALLSKPFAAPELAALLEQVFKAERNRDARS
jgi:DNA-binding NtrC family response regulator